MKLILNLNFIKVHFENLLVFIFFNVILDIYYFYNRIKKVNYLCYSYFYSYDIVLLCICNYVHIFPTNTKLQDLNDSLYYNSIYNSVSKTSYSLILCKDISKDSCDINQDNDKSSSVNIVNVVHFKMVLKGLLLFFINYFIRGVIKDRGNINDFYFCIFGYFVFAMSNVILYIRVKSFKDNVELILEIEGQKIMNFIINTVSVLNGFVGIIILVDSKDVCYLIKV